MRVRGLRLRREASRSASVVRLPAAGLPQRRLLLAARSYARRMAGASAASKTAAPRQSLELPAACSARCVCGPHSRSPTVHKP
jgi:hypothetical protein